MNVFITGASGFIGGAIATQLAKSNAIYAMARSEKSAMKIKKLGFFPVRCSLNNVTIDHLQNIEIVIHSAAYVEAWGTRAQFWETNVDGTTQLLEVAKKAGVKRFVHLSSEAAVFDGSPMVNVDEKHPYPSKTPYLYSETKAESERRVVAANTPKVFETVCVRPRMVWGKGDQTILPEVIKMINAGSFRWVKDGEILTSTTNIDNLVHGVTLAMSKGNGGEIYYITDNEISTFKYFLTTLLSTKNIVPPSKNISAGMLSFAAKIIEKIWLTFKIKKEPPITRFAADIIGVDCSINISKAKSELGYEPVISVEDGMKKLIKNSKH
ncbi:MAG: NAD-dependent epimerase/dehydratase family protein [Saprospiraceae bacterium]